MLPFTFAALAPPAMSGPPDPLQLDFTVTLPDRAMARCNPVRVPAGCPLRP